MEEVSIRIQIEIEDEISRYSRSIDCLSELLLEPALYLFASHGKRLRPLIALSLLHDFGVDYRGFILECLSLEMIHCSTLIHDDLPSLDNDDYRRGQLTVHKKFSEAKAVLSGDVLVPLAIKCITRSELSAAKKVYLIDLLTDSYEKVCSGQVEDLYLEKSRDNLERIHIQKTGYLFASSFIFAGVLADKKELIPKLRNCGIKFGLYYQILDDYLDEYGSVIERGRECGSDRKNHKDTYLTFFSKSEILDRLKSLRLEFYNEFKAVEENFSSEVRITKNLIYSVFDKVQS